MRLQKHTAIIAFASGFLFAAAPAIAAGGQLDRTLAQGDNRHTVDQGARYYDRETQNRTFAAGETWELRVRSRDFTPELFFRFGSEKPQGSTLFYKLDGYYYASACLKAPRAMTTDLTITITSIERRNITRSEPVSGAYQFAFDRAQSCPTSIPPGAEVIVFKVGADPDDDKKDFGPCVNFQDLGRMVDDYDGVAALGTKILLYQYGGRFYVFPHAHLNKNSESSASFKLVGKQWVRHFCPRGNTDSFELEDLGAGRSNPEIGQYEGRPAKDYHLKRGAHIYVFHR